MTDRNLNVRIGMDVGQLVAEANRGAQAMEKLGNSATRSGKQSQSGASDVNAASASLSGAFGQAAKDAEKSTSTIGGMAKKAGETFTAGISWAARAAVSSAAAMVTIGLLKSGAEFESNMAQMQAATQATDAEMTQLSSTARALGRDVALPTTSASDAAEAMLELGKGGLSASESMEAARGTLMLAAAAQISGARAAEVQTAALNAFSLQADQAGRVADVIAAVSVAAAGDINDFANGMAQAGLVAHGMGVSIEDTAATLGVFAQAGMSGSDAGTSFRTMLTYIASPSKTAAKAMDELGLSLWDAKGNFVGMSSLADQLASAHARLSTQEYNSAASTAFGTDALRGAIAMGERGAEGLGIMQAAVEREGAAQELAAARTQGLAGAWGTLVNTFEDVSLTIYQALSPALTAVVGLFADLMGVVGNVLGWITGLPGPILAIATALLTVTVLRGPLGSLWTAIVSGAETAALTAMVSAGTISTAGGIMAVGANIAKGAWQGLKAAFLSNPIGIAILAVTTALSFMSSQTEKAAPPVADLTAAIDKETGALKANAQEIAAKALADTGLISQGEALGISADLTTRAVLGQKDAIDAVNRAIAEGRAPLDGMTEAQKQNGAALGAASQMAAPYIAFQEALAANSGSLVTEEDKARAAIAGAAGAAKDATVDVGNFATATGDLGGASEEAKSPMDNLKSATDSLAGAASFADAAVQFLTLALDAQSGKAISHEQATRANDAALRAIGGSARDVAQAWADYQAAQDKVTEISNKNTDATYTNEQKQIDLAAANRGVADAADAVHDAEDKQSQANIHAQQTSLALATEAYATARAHGTLEDATAAANKVVEEQRAAFIASQSAADQESGAAATLAEKLFGIPGEVGTKLAAQDNATPVVDALKAKLGSLNGTTATAYLNAVKTGDWNISALRAMGDPGAGGHVTFARGGVVEYGKPVEVAAAGGLYPSQIARGGANLVHWAEPSLPWETYISGDPRQAGRSNSIMEVTAQRLGGQYIPPVAVTSSSVGQVAQSLDIAGLEKLLSGRGGGVHIGSIPITTASPDLMPAVEQLIWDLGGVNVGGA